MKEAETRADHIDLALAAAGWGTVEGSRIRREYPITQGRLEGLGRRGKALSADFRQTMGQTKVSEQTKVLGTEYANFQENRFLPPL